MTRFTGVLTGVLCVTFGFTAPAAAYRVDASTHTVAIHSLRDFDKCQKDHESSGSEVCLEALKIYVKAHPKYAFDAGKRALRHYMHWVALDFFAQALSGDSAAQHVGARGSAREQSVDADEMKKRCADDDVAAAVVSGLALPPHYPAVSLATKLVSGACREELEPVVASRLKGAGNAFRSNACPLVAQKVSKARCAPVAEAPVPGPAPEPTAADQLAAAPRLRQAPPARNEAPSTPPAQRLEAVFPAIPAGQPVAAPADAIGELKGLDWKLLNLDPESAELLRGPNGEELMMARTKPGGQEFVLLKFKGIRSPWNERVVVVVERSRAAGKDYVTVLGNREAIVMIERQRQYQAFPKGVTGGLWFNPVRPSDQALKLPLRREIESEFATAAGVGD